MTDDGTTDYESDEVEETAGGEKQREKMKMGRNGRQNCEEDP